MFSRPHGCRRNQSEFQEVISLPLLGRCISAVSLPGAFPHQLPIYQHVMLAAIDEAFSLGLIDGYVGAGEVLDELLPLVGDRQRYRKYQLLGRGNLLNFLFFFNGWHQEILNEDPRWNRGARRTNL